MDFNSGSGGGSFFKCFTLTLGKTVGVGFSRLLIYTRGIFVRKRSYFDAITRFTALVLSKGRWDPIAHVIHEWTYDAMCHDLLEMEGNKYVHVASERLHDKMKNFMSRNKAAQMHGRDGGEMSTRDLQKMVQALPQYNEQMDKLSLHVDINGIIREMGLKDMGQLEQDLVFGDAGTKDIIKFLKEEDATDEQKIRLLMIYVATHPEKFETDKLAKTLELADLLPEHMKAIYYMRFLESTPDKSNRELVSILQELDEQIEKQKLEINSLEESEQSVVDEDNVEDHTGVEVSRITTKDNFRLELELQKFQESQEKLKIP
uniref:Uncharacterized protein n=1 Tax=Lactuca sativa TaxID=4236 RepID=A0A9R1VG37_LACSA|nr:hypothetical protein LSAT_V11C500259410 [Lactuca sativa]